MRETRLWNVYATFAFAALLCAATTAQAQFGTVVLQNGLDVFGVSSYSGCDTLRIRDNLVDANAGDAPFVGDSGNDADNRFLIRFNWDEFETFCQSYGAGGDGLLKLVVDQADAQGDDFFDVYLVQFKNRGWTSDGSSWNWVNIESATPWQSSAGAALPIDAAGTPLETPIAGLGQPGDGYAATPIATINQAAYTPGEVISISIPKRDIQDLKNEGLLVRKRNEDGQANPGRLSFHGATAVDPSLRPSLTLPVVAGPPFSFDVIFSNINPDFIDAGEVVILDATLPDATTYQWSRNLVDIEGATNALLVFDPVKESDAGQYIVITDSCVGGGSFILTVRPGGSVPAVSLAGLLALAAGGAAGGAHLLRRRR